MALYSVLDANHEHGGGGRYLYLHIIFLGRHLKFQDAARRLPRENGKMTWALEAFDLLNGLGR